MLRLGSEPENMREMELDDIFISRLQLLIIMTKSYLSKYPLGNYREHSILENAVMRYDVTGKAPEPLGTRHPTATPFHLALRRRPLST